MTNAKLKIYKLYYNEIKEIYSDLYKDVFGETNDTQIPDYVYLGCYDNQYVGMVTAYIHNTDTIYIQMAGFTDGFRGYRAVGFFRQLIDAIHKEYDNIVFRIQNINVAALKVAMNIGFIIIGIKGDGMIENGIFKGRLYVELVKNKGE